MQRGGGGEQLSHAIYILLRGFFFLIFAVTPYDKFMVQFSENVLKKQ